MAGLLAFALLGGLAAAAYGASVLLVRDRPFSVRLAATFTLFLWCSIALFTVLSLVRLFRLLPLLVLIAGALAGLLVPERTRTTIATTARSDLDALRNGWRQLDWAPRLLLGGLLALLAIMLVRTTVTPPMGWDDLTYHLTKAGLWVEHGGFVSQMAPGSSEYYDYYASNGEVMWSWFLLPARDGAFLGFAAVVPWFASLVGGYTVARLLGRERGRSLTIGLALVSVAAVTLYIEGNYVDTFSLAAFTLSFAFLLECRRAFGWASLLLAAASLSYACGVKQGAALLAGAGLVWLVGIAIIKRKELRRPNLPVPLAAGIAILILVMIAGAPWYVRSAVDHGSPVYPTEVSLPGLKLAGNDQLMDYLALGHRGLPITRENATILLKESFGFLRTTPVNFGPLPAFWLAAGAVGLAYALVSTAWWFRRRARGEPVGPPLAVPALYLLLAFLFGVYLIISPDTAAFHVAGGKILGRLVLTAFAATVLLTAMLPWRFMRPLLEWMVAAQIFTTASAVALSTFDIDGLAFGELFDAVRLPLILAILVIVAAVVVAALLNRGVIEAPDWLERRWIAPVAAAVVLLLVLFALGSPVHSVREDARYPYYESVVKLESFRVEPMGVVACTWHTWRDADTGPPKTIAMATGGAVDFRYNFIGTDLQNRVIYVPITTDGSLLDYRQLLKPGQMDEKAWFQRLKEEGVTHLAVIPPAPHEQDVALRHPEIFKQVGTPGCNGSVLYAIDQTKI